MVSMKIKSGYEKHMDRRYNINDGRGKLSRRRKVAGKNLTINVRRFLPLVTNRRLYAEET